MGALIDEIKIDPKEYAYTLAMHYYSTIMT